MPSDDRSIVPQLEALRRELEQARMRAHAVADAAAPDLWARRPARAGWSAAECLGHLNLTSERFVPLIADALARARARGLTGAGPFRRDVAGWLLCRMLEPPYRVRVKTPPPFVPQGAEPVEPVLAAFDGWQSRLDALLVEANGLLLDRVWIVSPFAERVRYNGYSSFCIVAAHQRRHLWQAQRALASLG